MLTSSSMNATVAKIRAVRGKMFTQQQYRELMLKQTVPECAEYLAQSPRYKDVFRDADPNTIHRGYLEELLQKANLEIYNRLCGFQQLDSIPYYGFLLARMEISNILLMINSINSDLDKPVLAQLPGYAIKHSRVNLLELSQAGSFEELLEVLRGTPYRKPLLKVKTDPSGRADYTECELALRKDYFERLIQDVEHDFHGREEKEIKDIILYEVDTMNIINAYRMKKYFGYSSERIKQSLINVKGNPMGRLKEYFELSDPDDMLEWLKTTKYGKGMRETGIIETGIADIRYRKLSHILSSTTSAPAALYAYVRLSAVEVSNIVHIIEAVRYGADTTQLEHDLLIF